MRIAMWALVAGTMVTALPATSEAQILYPQGRARSDEARARDRDREREGDRVRDRDREREGDRARDRDRVRRQADERERREAEARARTSRNDRWDWDRDRHRGRVDDRRGNDGRWDSRYERDVRKRNARWQKAQWRMYRDCERDLWRRSRIDRRRDNRWVVAREAERIERVCERRVYDRRW